MTPSWVVLLVFTLLAFQVGLWLLARWLGRRLPWSVMALGVSIPLLFLSPWFAADRLLVPTTALLGQVPGSSLEDVVVDAHGRELGDAVYQFLPWEIEVRRAFSERRLPFWSDLLDGGSSPWVNLQAAVLSPIAWAVRWVPIQHFLLFCLALKILTALEGAYLLARAFGIRHGFALLVGISFSLSGAFAAWALFPHSAVVAWMPWLAAASILVVRARRRAPWAATAVAGALVLLAGHPEAALAAALFASVAALAVGRRRLRGWLLLAASAGLAVCLAAPILLPFADATSRSLRAESRRIVRVTASVEMPPAARGWFPPGRGQLLLTPLHPRVFGEPYEAPARTPPHVTETIARSHYAGLAVWIGVVCAVLLVARRSWILFGFALLLLLLAAGFRPVAQVIAASSTLRVVEWTRLVPAATLALCVLGGLGWQAVARHRRGRWLGLSCVAVPLLVTLAVRLDAGSLGLAVAALAIAVLFARGGRASSRVALVALSGLALFDLVPWGRRFLPVGVVADFYPTTAVVEALRSQTEGGFRVVGHDYLAYPSVLPVFGLAEARANNPLAPAAQIRALGATLGFSPDDDHYYSAVSSPLHPFARFLGIRAIVSNNFLPGDPSQAERYGRRLVAGDLKRWRIWVDDGDLPTRWFLPRQALGVEKGQVGQRLAALDDPWTVLVTDVDSAPSVAGAGSGVTVLASRPGRVRLRVDSGSETAGSVLLASSNPYPEGWRAQESGGPALPRVLVHGAFAGFLVPAGKHEIEARFVPPGFWVGCGIALAALVALALVSRITRR